MKVLLEVKYDCQNFENTQSKIWKIKLMKSPSKENKRIKSGLGRGKLCVVGNLRWCPRFPPLVHRPCTAGPRKAL